jgi:hypothetical protein
VTLKDTAASRWERFGRLVRVELTEHPGIGPADPPATITNRLAVDGKPVSCSSWHVFGGRQEAVVVRLIGVFSEQVAVMQLDEDLWGVTLADVPLLTPRGFPLPDTSKPVTDVFLFAAEVRIGPAGGPSS